jgi:hypothetical protein
MPAFAGMTDLLSLAAERAERLAAQRAARDRYFGFGGEGGKEA